MADTDQVLEREQRELARGLHPAILRRRLRSIMLSRA
jgi:hypothetical protein